MLSLLLSVVCAVFADASFGTPPQRERLAMNFDWKFTLGNANDAKADFDFGSYWSYLAKQNNGKTKVLRRDFDDSKWRTLNLPHDWGMELPFDEKAVEAWGSRPLGREFPETSVGWYRKAFVIPASDKGRRIAVEFEGVMHDCVVAVNGVLIGNHFSGYTSFSYDITDMIRFGETNVLVVRVDAQANEGWWYQGAGIYRNVWLTKTAPVHVPQWGTQVLTQMKGEAAQVTARTEVANDSPEPVEVVVQSTVLDDAGNAVGTVSSRSIQVQPWERSLAESEIRVAQPKLWSLETPTLYRLVTTLKVGKAEVDRYETPFGIRTVRFDAEKGFLLNGKPVVIKGVCDHQQQAIVGVAVPDSLWPWHVQHLKDELGANAIRMSHNPPPPALLDTCDRLGVLVMDEQRLFASGEEGLRQLDSFVRRDRNHPSIIIWSAGNEEWGLQSHPAGAPIMMRLEQEFHRLDPSRQVTIAGSNGPDFVGVNGAAEVRGVNYLHLFTKTNTLADYHQQHPAQPMVGTEDGYGDHVFKTMKEYPWYSGVFLWTGFAYFGESKWPDIIGSFGALDTCGFPRQSDYDRVRKAWLGKEAEEKPTGKVPARIQLAPARTTLNADGADTVVVNVAIVDEQNQRVGDATNLLTARITGPGVILGMANGDVRDHTSSLDASHSAFRGRAQLLVQATKQPGNITLEVQADGIKADAVEIKTVADNPLPSVP